MYTCCPEGRCSPLSRMSLQLLEQCQAQPRTGLVAAALAHGSMCPAWIAQYMQQDRKMQRIGTCHLSRQPIRAVRSGTMPAQQVRVIRSSAQGLGERRQVKRMATHAAASQGKKGQSMGFCRVSTRAACERPPRVGTKCCKRCWSCARARTCVKCSSHWGLPSNDADVCSVSEERPGTSECLQRHL